MTARGAYDGASISLRSLERPPRTQFRMRSLLDRSGLLRSMNSIKVASRSLILFFSLFGLFGIPLTSHAQQLPTVFRVGLLMHDGTPPGFIDAFRAGLKELGYVEGKNIAFDLHNAQGNNERLRAIANELVGSRPDLILALNTPAALAAKNATPTIPIVMASGRVDIRGSRFSARGA